MELQQRGVEFSQLFRRHALLRGPLLERMPPLEIQDKANSDDANEDVVLHLNGDDNSAVNSPTSHRIEEEVKFIIWFYGKLKMCKKFNPALIISLTMTLGHHDPNMVSKFSQV